MKLGRENIIGLLSLLICAIIVVLLIFCFSQNDSKNIPLSSERNNGRIFSPAKTHFSWDQYIDASRSAELIEFEKKLTEYMDNKYRNEKEEHVGFYFVDLKRNWKISYHEDHEFIPASLLKTPIMIAYFKEAEQNPLLLEAIINSGKFDLKEFEQREIPEDLRLKDSTDYQVKDLIKRMITLSDNRSDYLLYKNLDNQIFRNVFADLGIHVSDRPSPRLEFTPKEFSTYFYVLYNNLYLNQQYSQQALDIMKETIYANGLRAGVPKDIQIAHKFGLRISDSGFDEIHDCGIFYLPKNHYLLCVMTLGHNIPQQEKNIEEVSRMFYEFASSQL